MKTTSRFGMWICLLLLFITAASLVTYGVLVRNKVPVDGTITRPEVTTPQGTVRGMNMATHHNRTVFGFMGIPFAEPPLGHLRFRAPVAPNAWEGILDGSREKDPCPQLDGQNIIGNEDCLHLNVYTPMLPASENSTLLPVMMFIVGGAFKKEINSPLRYGPDFLLDKDVLLVVPNYRLGALGYLSTGDEVSPGNYGLKDMVQALRWIQENIQYFGGDPDQVTLFGGSSGAVSADLLSLSNSTNGLFHKCITQSGSALSLALRAPREGYADLATQFGEYLGCPTNTSTVLVDCLRDLSASQLVKATSSVYSPENFLKFVWIPTSEPDIEGALITDSPANLFAAGKVRDMPRLSTVVTDEGLDITIPFYEDPDSFEEFLDNIDSLLPPFAHYAHAVDNVTAWTTALKSYYLNDLTANRSLLLTNLTHLLGDALYRYPVYDGVQQQLVLSKSPQYFGSFEYQGTFSYNYFFSGGSTRYTGVTHGDEIIYLFHNHDHLYGPPDYENTDTDWMMVDTVVQLWTSFVIDGTPTTAGLNSSIIWEPYSSRKNYLQIGNGSDPTLQVKYDLLKERMEFWDELIATTSWK